MAVLSQAFELLEDMRKNQALPNDEVGAHERKRGREGGRWRERKREEEKERDVERGWERES